MPLTRIEGRRPRSDDEVQAVIEALYQAQREALQVPEWDRQIRYVEHKADYFHVVPGRTENYLLVEISLFAGRSIDAKRALYRSIVQRLGRLGVQPSDITIVVYDIPLHDWGIRGGQAASDVDLGFKVDI